MEKVSLKINGIKNDQDANKILQALHEVWGIREAEVSVVNQTATFSYDEKAASQTDFIQAVKDTGFHIND
ncbi:heavy-metal-associated domain-containing protein [Bacillus sp. RG28]|uniref:Heavy-metal-associated domain-containing protein n=1 Tax=Gottfriedia endophytica TaxID=2820819 RepID=A0A940NVL9_9BACI|nr:heavy-metal-associated domain-containing protein [Gottfriedia endophytica]MBP0725743.1 heavy-metal-associated domain-containing protein [Gottfriedia endophytica]